MRIIRHPVLCNYYVTYRCNASCGFCDIWEKPSPYITLEQAKHNFRDLKKLGVNVIDFTGGEPLLHRELPQLLQLAKQAGFMTTVTTNTLLYPKQAVKLKGLVDMLHFSLDSAYEEQHNASRGVQCFDKLMESIEVAKSLGERPDILFTVHSGNIAEIKEVYGRISLPNKLMLILNPIFAYNEVGGQLSAEALNELEHWGKQKMVYLNKAFISLRRDGGNHIDQPVCKAGSTTVVISPDNKLVLPCYHLGLEELPIENNLYDLWNSTKVQNQIALEGKHAKCEGCTVNCYFMPSFHVETSKYMWESIPSTLKYAFEKGTWKHRFRTGAQKASLF
jgi:MoaA/NifB/PqqE/SkfB family radical SAM enzyme